MSRTVEAANLQGVNDPNKAQLQSQRQHAPLPMQRPTSTSFTSPTPQHSAIYLLCPPSTRLLWSTLKWGAVEVPRATAHNAAAIGKLSRREGHGGWTFAPLVSHSPACAAHARAAIGWAIPGVMARSEAHNATLILASRRMVTPIAAQEARVPIGASPSGISFLCPVINATEIAP